MDGSSFALFVHIPIVILMTTKNGGHFSSPPNLGIQINYFSYLLDAFFCCLCFFCVGVDCPNLSKSFEFLPPNFNTWNKEGDTKVPNPQKIIR
jgi:hypothetical protein